jgi:hypothetical protein
MNSRNKKIIGRVFGFLLGSGLIVGIFISLMQIPKTHGSDARERLNKLFYWQVADELKLSTLDEKKMVALIEDIQKLREDALKKRDSALEDLRKIEKKLTVKEVEPRLANYQEAVEALARLDVEEFSKLREILGVENLARYYLVREKLAKRVREAIKNVGSEKVSK